MAVEAPKPKGGLEDVVAATSSICYLDGDRGVLAYYGYDIHDLAQARRSRKSATCCGTAGCRTAPSSAICSRSWPPRGRSPSRSSG